MRWPSFFIRSLFELVFSVAVAKHIVPDLKLFKVQEEARLAAKLASKIKKTREAATKELNKEVTKRKTALEMAAKQYFQRRFEGELGQGLRVFHPEPQKGWVGDDMSW